MALNPQSASTAPAGSPQRPPTARLSEQRSARRRRNRVLRLGLPLLALTLLSLLAPWLAPYEPRAVVAAPVDPPSRAHWLGADHLGRDVWSRLLHGGRWTLGAALLAAGVTAVPGALLGLLAGYFGGPIETLIGRGVDLLLAFPRLLLALGIVALSGQGLLNVALAVGLTGVPVVARIVRGATLTVRHQTYVEAAHALGASDLTVIRRHIWRNVAGTAVVVTTLQVGWATLDVSALSFLGLGPALGTPEWGTMLNEARLVLRQAPWVALAPGTALASTVLLINLLGDALRDALDPQTWR